MAIRFRRSVRIAPGLRVNIGKTSGSLRIGPRGAGVTIGPKGKRVSVGLPGTGLSYTSGNIPHGAAAGATGGRSGGIGAWIVGGVVALSAAIYLPLEPTGLRIGLAAGAGLVTAVALGFVLRPRRPPPAVEAGDEPDDIDEENDEAEDDDTFEIDVVGESHSNADGTSRQEIIAGMVEGEGVRFQPEPENPYDANAVAVLSGGGQIGYVSRQWAPAIGKMVRERSIARAQVSKIAGGTKGKPSRGVWIEITTR